VTHAAPSRHYGPARYHNSQTCQRLHWSYYIRRRHPARSVITSLVIHIMLKQLATAALLVSVAKASASMKALVYRGSTVCEGCPESVAELLENSPWKFDVTFAGPNEDVDVTEKSLADVRVFAFPGGPGTLECPAFTLWRLTRQICGRRTSNAKAIRSSCKTSYPMVVTTWASVSGRILPVRASSALIQALACCPKGCPQVQRYSKTTRRLTPPRIP
jgi:hypothetical protein